MKSIVDRGSLTDAMLSTLLDLGYPVGDGEMPTLDTAEHAGWNGDPNTPGAVYVPYYVLSAQTATISSGSLADPQDGWQLPYSLASFGISRKQTESLANLGRKKLRELKGQNLTLDGETYRVQQVQFAALGAPTRVDQTSPSTFGEVDTLTIWITQ